MGRQRDISIPGPSGGLVTDFPPHVLKDDEVPVVQNMLFDIPGTPRKRGGTRGVYTDTVGAKLYGDRVMPTEDGRLIVAAANRTNNWQGSGTQLLLVDRNYISNTANTDTQAMNANAKQTAIEFGRPFRVGKHIIFPITRESKNNKTAETTPYIMFGGSSGLFTEPAVSAVLSPTIDVVAGQNYVDITSAIKTALVALGASSGFYIYLIDSSINNVFVSRVTSIETNRVYIEDTPRTSFTAEHYKVSPVMTNLFGYNTNVSTSGPIPFNLMRRATAMNFWKSRVLYANVAISAQYADAGAAWQHYPNRLYWSNLVAGDAFSRLPGFDGLAAWSWAGWELNNYLEVPSDTIWAVIPQGDSLYLLCNDAIYRVTGDLTTQTIGVGGLTYKLTRIQNSVGVLGINGWQESKYGIIFPSADGVYLFDGYNLINLTEGKIKKKWLDWINADLGFEVLGSAMIDTDNYFINTSEGQLMVRVRDRVWTEFTNINVTTGELDPVGRQNVFAMYVVDDLTAEPVGQNLGHVVKLDNILKPEDVAAEDSNNTDVHSMIRSKTFSYGTLHQLKRWKRAVLTVRCVYSSAPGQAGDTGTLPTVAFKVLHGIRPKDSPEVKHTEKFFDLEYEDAVEVRLDDLTTFANDSHDYSEAIAFELEQTGECSFFEWLMTAINYEGLDGSRSR